MNTARFSRRMLEPETATPMPSFIAGVCQANGMFGYVVHNNLTDLAAYVARTQAKVLFLFGLS